MDEIKREQMFIKGTLAPADDAGAFESVTPASVGGRAGVPHSTAGVADWAMRAAHRAFDKSPWRRMSATQRGTRRRRVAQCLAPVADRRGRIETTRSGEPLRETTRQARIPVETYGHSAGLADEACDDRASSGPDVPLSLAAREPLAAAVKARRPARRAADLCVMK
jgi:aldehyde dehydrogenase (NAD+)